MTVHACYAYDCTRVTELLMDAGRLVVRCRKVLSWTYVHAFYMLPDDEGAARNGNDGMEGIYECPAEWYAEWYVDQAVRDHIAETGNSKERFEHAQGSLEMFTEQLTALTEKVCLSEEHLLKMEREPEQFEVTLRNHMAAVEKFLAVIESE